MRWIQSQTLFQRGYLDAWTCEWQARQMELCATCLILQCPSLNNTQTVQPLMCLRKIKGLIIKWLLNILPFQLLINTWMKTWFNILGKGWNTELQMKALMTIFQQSLEWNVDLKSLHLNSHSLNVWIVIFSHLTWMCRRAQLCVQTSHGKTSMVQGQDHSSSNPSSVFRLTTKQWQLVSCLSPLL